MRKQCSLNLFLNGKSKSTKTNTSSSYSYHPKQDYVKCKMCKPNKINISYIPKRNLSFIDNNNNDEPIGRHRTRTPNLDKLLINLKKEANEMSHCYTNDYSNFKTTSNSESINFIPCYDNGDKENKELKEKNRLLEKKLNNTNELLVGLIEKASLYEKLYEDLKKKNLFLQNENDRLKETINSLLKNNNNYKVP